MAAAAKDRALIHSLRDLAGGRPMLVSKAPAATAASSAKDDAAKYTIPDDELRMRQSISAPSALTGSDRSDDSGRTVHG